MLCISEERDEETRRVTRVAKLQAHHPLSSTDAAPRCSRRSSFTPAAALGPRAVCRPVAGWLPTSCDRAERIASELERRRAASSPKSASRLLDAAVPPESPHKRAADDQAATKSDPAKSPALVDAHLGTRQEDDQHAQKGAREWSRDRQDHQQGALHLGGPMARPLFGPRPAPSDRCEIGANRTPTRANFQPLDATSAMSFIGAGRLRWWASDALHALQVHARHTAQLSVVQRPTWAVVRIVVRSFG